MFREATLADLSCLLKIASHEAGKFPVRPDKKKIRKLIISSISAKSNYCLVSEFEGAVTGALIAVAHEGLWFERKHLSILLFTTSTKGAGIAMLRHLMQSVKKGGSIKVVTTDFIVPSRMAILLSRVGLTQSNTYTFFK
jgi:hypothetical protein